MPHRTESRAAIRPFPMAWGARQSGARRAALVVVVVMLASACAKERPVEAPVVDVTIASQAGTTGQIVAEKSSTVPNGTLTGRWTGTGVQSDGQSWPMTVVITTTSPGLCAAVEYPSIPCRGEWRCSAFQSGVLEAHERILEGDASSLCVDDGTMTMRLAADGTLEWKWQGDDDTTARATLRRIR